MSLLDLGERIRTLRKQKGMTQAELAKEAGISRATLSKLENGLIAQISVVTLAEILNALGYELDITPLNPFASED